MGASGMRIILDIASAKPVPAFLNCIGSDEPYFFRSWVAHHRAIWLQINLEPGLPGQSGGLSQAGCQARASPSAV